MHIEKTPLLRILQIGIPAGIQGAIFSISNVFIQSGINSFGENAIAGSSLALNFEYFTYDIANAFAQAAVTFTSQNYGAGDLRRCKKDFPLLHAVRRGVYRDSQCGIHDLGRLFCQHLHHEQRRRVRLPSAVCGMSARSRVSPPPMRSKARLRGMGKSLEPRHLHRARHGRFPTHLDGNGFPSRAHIRDAMDVYVASWVFTGGALLLVWA